MLTISAGVPAANVCITEEFPITLKETDVEDG
jgi:hypothetical protein